MRHLIIALFALVATSAQADEIVIHTLSIHTKAEYTHTSRQNFIDEQGNYLYTEETKTQHRYNNFNYGLAYRWDNGWEVGMYHNSFRNNTFYVAKEWMFTESFGAMVGAGTGYDVRTDSHPIAFLGVFQYKYKLDDKWTAAVQFVPPVKTLGASGVAHLTFSRQFKGLDE